MSRLDEKITTMLDTEIDYDRGQRRLDNLGERQGGFFNVAYFVDRVVEKTGQPRKRVLPRVIAALESHPHVRVVPPSTGNPQERTRYVLM